jgi:hypothetical protein
MKGSPTSLFAGTLCLILGFGPSTFTRSTVANVGRITTGAHMLEPRSGHTATLLRDGRVLIAGGMRRNQDFYKTAEIYDPSREDFKKTGDMTVQRVGHVAVLLRSGQVLIAGGWIGRDTTDTAEVYDAATGRFTPIAHMTRKRAHPSATLLSNGDVLIVGGTENDGPYDGVGDAEIFHTSSMTFTRTSPTKQARVAHTATLLSDGRVLIVGGKHERVHASAELFDPKTQTFTETGPLHTARYKHTAALLSDGRVLIAGGSDERDWRGTMNSAELYDPKTGKFTLTASLAASRFKLPDEAVILQSGQVLIAGGSKQVEVYDPATSRFVTASGELSESWHYMSETRLRDGRVLLAGGYPDSDRATSETWIYRP